MNIVTSAKNLCEPACTFTPRGWRCSRAVLGRRCIRFLVDGGGTIGIVTEPRTYWIMISLPCEMRRYVCDFLPFPGYAPFAATLLYRAVPSSGVPKVQYSQAGGGNVVAVWPNY